MKAKLPTIVYTAIITILVIAIAALIYREFFWAAEKLEEIEVQLRAVNWQLYVNSVERKKILRTEDLDVQFAQRKMEYYGLDPDSVNEVKADIKERKSQLSATINELQKKKKKLETKKKILKKENS